LQKPVEFESCKQTVRGTLHIPEGAGKFPAVLLCHGFTGSRTESHFLFVKMSRELERRGIASLRFDFRGSGESDGEFVEMTVSGEICDARAALDFLARQRRVDRGGIGMLGLSLGGFVAAHVASSDERVKSLVLWSAVATSELIIERVLTPPNRRKLKRDGYIDAGGLAVGKGFFEDVAQLNALDRIARSRAAILIIHGADDEVVPVEHAELYRSAARNAREVRKVIVKKADHVFKNLKHERQVIELTADWFSRTL